MATRPMGLFGAMRLSLRALWRAARELFYEVTGTLFFVLALSAAQSAWRAWRRGAGQWMIEVAVCYALLMVLFGILSFRDSRRVR